jgi:hypothetical protein
MSTMNVDNISPFDDPAIVKRQKITASASFKAFNVVANRLLEELTRIYPKDVFIRFVSEELKKVSTSKNNAQHKAGALFFFHEIRTPTQREDGSACQYVDLLVAHSEHAFDDPIPVFILQNAKMSEKWKAMPPDLKVGIWQYIDRLTHLSAQAVFSSSRSTVEMNELSRAVVRAAMDGTGNSPQDIVNNLTVQKAAEKFVNTIK